MAQLKGHTAEFFDNLNAFFDGWFMYLLQSSFAFWLGLILVFQHYILKFDGVQEGIRHVHHRCLPAEAYWLRNRKDRVFKKMGSSTLRTVGINIIVFQIYYQRGYDQKADINDYAFITSLVWILFEAFFLWSFFSILQKTTKCNCEQGLHLSADWMDACILPAFLCRPIMNWLRDHSRGMLTIEEDRSYLPLSAELDERPKEEGEEETVGAIRNVYMDISRPFRLPMIFFISQIGLIAYYIYALDTDKKSHDIHRVSAMKWMVGVLLTVVAAEAGKEDGKDEAGSKYHSLFWANLFEATLYDEELKLDHEPRLHNRVFWIIKLPLISEWRFRRFFDFAINKVCRTILLGTSPIILCVEKPLDFIKDVMAVFFICAIDDYDDPKDWKEIRERFTRKTLYLPHTGVRFKDRNSMDVQFQLHSDTKKFSCKVFRDQEYNQQTFSIPDIVDLSIHDRSMTIHGPGDQKKVIHVADSVPQDVLHNVKNLFKLENKRRMLVDRLEKLDEQLALPSGSA